MNSNKNQMLFEDNSYAGNQQRKKIHIPFCDVDDLAFKNRHDPNFIASISKFEIFFFLFFYKTFYLCCNQNFYSTANLMQVPSTITVNNGNMPNRNNYNYFENPSFPMDIPEKLTGETFNFKRVFF